MSRNKLFPIRSKLQTVKQNRGGWLCYVMDFYGGVVATVSGKTRDEARVKGREERDAHLASMRETIANNRIAKGEKWTSAWRLRPGTTARILLDAVRAGLLQGLNAESFGYNLCPDRRQANAWN